MKLEQSHPVQGEPLRTDIEARNVQQALRKSSNRDLVEIRHLPAAQVEDLLDALNEFKPDIVHFSGHGGGGSLLFDHKDADDDGGVDIDFALVNDIVSATHSPPKLLVFTACDSLKGAHVFLKNVDAVVAMSSEIADAAAVMFSSQFYSALASGQALDAALKQGRVVLKAAKLPDADLPKILVRKGLVASGLKYV